MSKYIATYSCQINDQKNQCVDDDDDDERMKFDRLINEVCQWSERNNVYKIFYTQTLNILLMGKVGTGKTTIAQVLENPCFIPFDPKLYSHSKEISIHPVAIDMGHKEKKNVISCLNLIDTPGLFHKSLKINQLKRTIKKCADEDLNHIHLFAFVISFQRTLDEDEINSMIFMNKYYPHLHPYLLLIITHAEESNEQERKEKLNQFFHSERISSSNLKELFDNRIFFLGSLRSQLITHPNRQSIREQIENVHQMRNLFIQFLIHLDPQDYFHIQTINNPTKTCTLL